MGLIVKAVKGVVKAVGKVVGKVVKVIGGIFGFNLGGKGKEAAPPNTLTKQIDPEAPRKIIFGKTAAPLDLRYWEVWGTNGKQYSEVLALAAHKCHSVGDLYIEEKLGISAAGAVQAAFTGVLSRIIKLGADGQAGTTVGGGTQWNAATCTFDSVCYIILDWTPDEKKLPNGIPSRYTQIVEGMPVYDPRRDSTVPGGSGAHRIDNQNTWEYGTLDGNGQPIGRNNALQALAYLIGWTAQVKDAAGVVTGRMLTCGRGVLPEDINLQTFIAGANNCEAAGYYTDLVLSTEDDHVSNENAITASGLIGRLIDPGGLWSYYANVDDTANIAVELTDADVIDSSGVSWEEYKGMSEQFNQVAGKFINPQVPVLYQPYFYPMVRDAVYENNLGRKVRKTLDFRQILDGVVAQRLARLELNAGQYQGEFGASFNYRALAAQAYSVVRYTSERFGWTKLFRVWRHEISSEDGVSMLLKEIHPSIWGAGTVTYPEAPGAGLNYNPRTEYVVGNFTAVQVPMTAPDGTKADGFRALWDAPPAQVRRIEIRYKLNGTVYWTTVGQVERDETTVTVGPLLSGAIYDIQARAISIHEIPGPWANAGPFQMGTTGNVNYNAIAAAGGTANWSQIVDNDGNKPTDNADVTAANVASGIAGQSPWAATTDPGYVAASGKLSGVDAGATNDKFVDTRNTNQLPSWYRANYPLRVVREFKDAQAIGITSTAGSWGTLYTTVDYSDASGGVVKQHFTLGVNVGSTIRGVSFERTGDGNDTAWLSWEPVYTGLRKPWFGSDLLEAQGGNLATLSNFKTLLGISSGFTGQKALATKDFANWNSDIEARPSLDNRVYPMDYANVTAFGRDWDTSGTGEIAIIDTTDTGGKAVAIGNNVGDDYLQMFAVDWMPYDGYSLYMIEFDVYIGNADPATVLYLGLQALDRGGNNLGGSYNYCCASGFNQNANQGRQKFRAYLKGWAPVNNTSNGNGNDNPNAPQGLPDGSQNGFGLGGAVKIRPMGLINYQGTAGYVEIHGVRIVRYAGALAAKGAADWNLDLDAASKPLALRPGSLSNNNYLIADYMIYGDGYTTQYYKPQEINSNRTEGRIASGFAGQKLLATQDSVAFGSQYVTGFGALAGRATVRLNYEVRDLDDAYLGRESVITPLGVASGFAGQQPIATSGSWNDIFDTTRPYALKNSQFFGSGYLKADSLYNDAGNKNLNVYFPEDVNSNRTEGRIASGFTGQTNAATAPDYKVFNNRLTNGLVRVGFPEGGAFDGGNSHTGRINISFPAAAKNSYAMITFDVVIYNYTTNTTQRYQIAGYIYNGSNTDGTYTGEKAWYNMTVTYLGAEENSLRVGFGYTDDGVPVVQIGFDETVWYYPKISVENVRIPNSPAVANWETGWSIAIGPGELPISAAANGWFVNKPRAGDAVYGEGIKEAASGAIATLGNFKTGLGVASGFAGQATIATDLNAHTKVSRLSGSNGRVLDPTIYNTSLLLSAKNSTNLTPSYDTSNASYVTVSIGAHTRTIAGQNGPVDLSYGAGSFTVPYSTTFYCYLDDVDMAGVASPTYQYTTDPKQLLHPNRYFVLSAVTPAASGGTVEPPPYNECVASDSYMASGGQAWEVRVGDFIEIIDYATMNSLKMEPVIGSRLAISDCVRLISESGISLVCSVTTPCTLPDGSTILAPEASGYLLPVRDKTGFRWEKIVEVMNVGKREVAHISCSENTFGAGEFEGKYIYTHNAVVKQ